VCLGSSWRLGLARVFTIVNVMLGSSLLVFPWAFAGSGLVPGTILVVTVGGFCHYTSSLILRWSEGFEDFSDMCNHYLGAWAWHVSLIASLVVLLGALLAYHTLMSDFLHALLLAMYPIANSPGGGSGSVLLRLLQQRSLAPLPIALVLFPFTNVRDISQLARYTSFGIVAVVICIVFIVVDSVGLSVDALQLYGGLSFTLYPTPLPAPFPSPISHPTPSSLPQPTLWSRADSRLATFQRRSHDPRDSVNIPHESIATVQMGRDLLKGRLDADVNQKDAVSHGAGADETSHGAYETVHGADEMSHGARHDSTGARRLLARANEAAVEVGSWHFWNPSPPLFYCAWWCKWDES